MIDSAPSILDVSEVVWLRKRLGRAQLAVKIGGLDLTITLGAGVLLRNAPEWITLVALAVAVFGVFRLARAVRQGARWAGTTLVFMLIPAACLALVDVGGHLVHEDWQIGLDVLTLSRLVVVYMLWRGLVAFRVARGDKRSKRSCQAVAWPADPWEPSTRSSRPPVFGSRGKLTVIALLILTPVPILSQLSFIVSYFSGMPRNDPVGQFAYQLVYLGGVVLMLVPTTAIYRAARRRAVARATQILARRQGRPIVYLRSFADDKLKMRARAANGRTWLESVLRVGFEEVIVDHLFRYGPVVAIGRPGEKNAPLGAAREYVATSLWQERVAALLSESAAIVVVAGRTEGLAWEIQQVVQRGLLDRLIVLLPPIPEQNLLVRWAAFLRVLPLTCASSPVEMDPRRARAIVFRPDGAPLAIEAEDRDAWSYEVVLDAAVTWLRRGLGATSSGSTGVPVETRGRSRYTASTDVVGRAVDGMLRGGLVASALALGALEFQLSLVYDHLPRAAPLVGAMVVAGVVWLMLWRWLSAADWRERTIGALLSSVGTIVPPVLGGGSFAATAGIMATCGLLGAYYAWRRDRVQSRRRQPAQPRGTPMVAHADWVSAERGGGTGQI